MFKARVRFASRWSITAASAIVLFSSPLVAQEQVAKPEWSSKWSVSLGVDPFKTDGGLNFSENFAAAIAKQWSRPGSRLGFRAQLSTGRQPSTTQSFNAGACDACSLTRTLRYTELSTAAIYTFRNNRKFRPYLLGGTALYAVRSSYLARGLVISDPDPGDRSTSTVWSFGLTTGFGANFRLFGTDFFVEQRILLPQPSTGYTNSLVAHPFSIGVKFDK